MMIAAEHILSERFRVSSARMQDFARVFSPEASYNPVFAHVPVMQSMVEVLAGLSDVSGIHAEHDFVLRKPMMPSQTLTTKTWLDGATPIRSGLLGRVRSVTHDATGALVSSQVTSVLLRGVSAIDGVHSAPAPDRPEIPDRPYVVTKDFAIGPETAAAYAEASRDYAPYTLDADAAAGMGFPGPILHGMATLGFAADAVAARFADGDGHRIARLGGRFTRPVVLDGPVTLRVSMSQTGQTIAFDLSVGDGRQVLTRGYAELAP